MGRTKQERADQTRRALLHAAAETFEARGYHGTSLQDIVTGRGVSKGALYFHFPSKKDLAVAILEEQHALWPRLLTDLRGRERNALRLLLELLMEAAGNIRDDVVARAGTRLACEKDQIGTAVPALFTGWVEIVEGLLIEAHNQGDLRPDVAPRIVAEFLVAGFAGLQRMRTIKGLDGDIHPHLTAMLEHLLPGLVKAEKMAEVLAALNAIGHRTLRNSSDVLPVSLLERKPRDAARLLSADHSKGPAALGGDGIPGSGRHERSRV
ncbi:ScbR family autoregulator-binding transcription factor [Actinomadura fulvescens]|uniref:HTH tetR-type domain-containing protein n=1 Tax=Actinomadura fulvescens TaxID=46160 RepID=A0ABN3PRM6_9ACTN